MTEVQGKSRAAATKGAPQGFLAFLEGQSGGVQVLVTLLLVVLAGFAALSLDLGRAYAERQHLQNVADASALAGSRYLPDQSQAANAALDLAAANGVRRETVTVEFPTQTRISVRVERHLPYLLASVLGVGGAEVAAVAEVQRGGVAVLSGGDSTLGPGGCRSQDGEGDGEEGDSPEGEDGHDKGDGSRGGSDDQSRDDDKSRDGEKSHDGDKSRNGDRSNDGDSRDGSGDSRDGSHDNSSAESGSEAQGDDSRDSGGEGEDRLPDCRRSESDQPDGEAGDGRGDHGDGKEGGGEGSPGGTGMAPLAIEQDVVQGLLPGDFALLKVGPGGQTRGNFHALALGARGAKVYERNLLYGFPGVVRAGDVVTTQPGDMAGPTDRAIRRRIDADPDADWQTVRPGSPRLLYVGVIDTLDGVTGRDTVTILGFAAFFLEECGGGDPGTVCGRFLHWVLPGQAGGGSFGFDAVQIIR